jgi:two-component system nitrogen regulation sensor histidine kinase NtrY
LKREELPDGSSALGLFAVRAIHGVEPAVRLVGGRRLDQGFLSDLPVASGMQAALYRIQASSVDNGPQGNVTTAIFDPKELVDANGAVPSADRYGALIGSALKTGAQQAQIVYLTSDRGDSINATAIPLKDESGNVLAVLLVGISRASMVEAEQHIRAIAYGVASGGILLAIVFSLWIAARVSRPIEQLAHAAEEVAGGNWDARAPERGRDEIGMLARSFNHMTAQLATQRDQLVQSERVAAWRELARRLAHELKNPLFPLQLTVENLTRARALPEAEFDEVFRESTATLSAEIANLKTIIGRFSDFSKMPKPELERVDARDVLERVRSLYEGVASREAKIDFEMKIASGPMPLMVDPELLHRALSNLVLNAMDAMPNGGKLTLGAQPAEDKIEIRVSDTGEGLTQEECERLFTPYYTTKTHGTGLGLAIVQSVVADHGGAIAVEGRTGSGATFIITLPKADA